MVSKDSIQRTTNLLKRSSVILNLKYDATLFSAENNLSVKRLDVGQHK